MAIALEFPRFELLFANRTHDRISCDFIYPVLKVLFQYEIVLQYR